MQFQYRGGQQYIPNLLFGIMGKIFYVSEGPSDKLLSFFFHLTPPTYLGIFEKRIDFKNQI